MKPSIGQRNTRQRQVILEELRRLTSHPSATDLYEIVRQRLPRISLGTVYRNLELLARSGVIQKLEIGGAQTRFDGNPKQHHHVRCISCGRVDDAHEVSADLLGDEVKNIGGYEILGHRLEFVGLCPVCKAQQEQETDKIIRQEEH